MAIFQFWGIFYNYKVIFIVFRLYFNSSLNNMNVSKIIITTAVVDYLNCYGKNGLCYMYMASTNYSFFFLKSKLHEFLVHKNPSPTHHG